MTVEEEKLLRLMVDLKAYIIVDEYSGMHAVHAGGDLRTRPIRWIEAGLFERLMTNQWIVRDRKGARVSDHMQRRILAREQDGAYVDPHRELETVTTYVPGGVKRPVTRNTKVTALERLARSRDTKGRLRLTAAEVEAGRQFAIDYDQSGMGFAATQDYERVHVDSGGMADGTERAIIHAMDRRKRVSEAISCLGPGLDRALIAVCCENWSIEKLEQAENWARNSGYTLLKFALGRLAEFYGTHVGEPVQRR